MAVLLVGEAPVRAASDRSESTGSAIDVHGSPGVANFLGRRVDAGRSGRVFSPVMTMADKTLDVEPQPAEFDRFFEKHYGSVVALAQSLTLSRPVAEDVAQEAFASALMRWPKVSAYERPDLWVKRVALNRTIGVARRGRSEKRAVDRLKTYGVPTQVVPAADVADQRLWSAVRRLPPRQAQLVALVYVDDQSIEDAAGALGLTPSTARTHLQRARAALAAALQPEEAD